MYKDLILTGPDWPNERQDRSAVAEGLISTGVTDATSLEFEFTEAQLEHLTKALDAPICEFVCGYYLVLSCHFTCSHVFFSASFLFAFLYFMLRSGEPC